MLAPAKIILEVDLVLRGRSFISDFVALIAVVNQNDVRFVLDLDVAHIPKQQKNVFGVDDLETVLLRILDVVAVRDSSAVRASVIQRIVAPLFAAVFEGEIRLAAQGLDSLIKNRPRLPGVVGVIHAGGWFGRSRGRSGLALRHGAKQQYKEESIHDSLD